MKKFFNKIKVYLITFLLVISCVIFGACSPITLKTTQTSSGQILVNFSFDLQQLETLSAKQNAYKLSRTYFNQLFSAYKENLVEIFSNVYSYYDLSLDTFDKQLSYVLTNNTKFLVGDVVISPDNVLFASNSEKMQIDVAFASIYAYIFFFYPNAFMFDSQTKSVKLNNEVYSSLIDAPIPSVETNIENQFFVNKFIQTCSPFSYNGEESKLLYDYMSGANFYPVDTLLSDVACQELGLSSEQAKYIFTFATPYNRLHSNGRITRTSSGLEHTWEFSGNEEKLISVWRNTPNYVVYYVLSICVGIVIILVALIFLFKKKNKENLEVVNKEDNNTQNVESDLEREVANMSGTELLKKIDELANKKD